VDRIFRERAAILEFDGKIPREEAEQAAWMETSAAMLKSRVKAMAQRQADKLHIPTKPPIHDRKSISAGD